MNDKQVSIIVEAPVFVANSFFELSQSESERERPQVYVSVIGLAFRSYNDGKIEGRHSQLDRTREMERKAKKKNSSTVVREHERWMKRKEKKE